jgi:hypothetical protein
LWEVNLADDTLRDTRDTVLLEVWPVAPKDTAENRNRKRAGLLPVDFWPVQDVRFSYDYTSAYRNEEGAMTPARFRKLALEAIEEYLFDSPDGLPEYAAEGHDGPGTE